ncbi:hypothetical protein [Streptomyces griseorubiginosus]|uniref:hypothetical protein n=1 Tax=Streptomyces griseorubiginosus TaxID=67304 RepID=UPI002E81B961|nr:hypothetical protein [Streptomyces griseorubiginosus]WUB42277.1 hypothetical protein OHN19_02610 [Streptomyces griseorubiginosus]WUB50796.1 hypothetical protein OG942_02605 [Streptomyces griseorubiginosus]
MTARTARTARTNTTSTAVELDELLAAARELSLAGRWERALRLLDSASCATPGDRARLALAAAEVALQSDWFGGTALTATRAEHAEKQAPSTGGGSGTGRDPGFDWDLGFVRLRHDYLRLLRGDGAFRPGPEGKDPEALTGLRRRALALREDGPDEVRRGWASMYLGLIADNLFAERTAAPAHYEAALRAGEAGGDDLLAREALRHLGDHDHDDGDHVRALERWERATALGARAGMVPGVLTQQLLLAVLARDAGDEAGATALAREIARWAEAIGMASVHAQATGFLAGTDPTAAPQESGS